MRKHHRDAAIAINLIQFQQGLSVTHFLADYSTKELCEAALLKAHWTQSFRYPARWGGGIPFGHGPMHRGAVKACSVKS